MFLAMHQCTLFGEEAAAIKHKTLVVLKNGEKLSGILLASGQRGVVMAVVGEQEPERFIAKKDISEIKKIKSDSKEDESRHNALQRYAVLAKDGKFSIVESSFSQLKGKSDDGDAEKKVKKKGARRRKKKKRRRYGRYSLLSPRRSLDMDQDKKDDGDKDDIAELFVTDEDNKEKTKKGEGNSEFDKLLE
jgi:hypothetical protein